MRDRAYRLLLITNDLERQNKGFYGKNLQFSTNNSGTHALDMACNTGIHALDMALGVICLRVWMKHGCELRFRSHRAFTHTLCLKKNIPDIFDSNLKTNYQILTIFSTNIPDTACHQKTIQLPTSPNVCFCTTWGKQNQRNITFLSNAIWLLN